ncbi:hypothetical protein PENSPDRAFT_113691 [Peniophora sp. CONT]|nr:hypothetical protein PENSPDRAFT_113691 [Peniophora sp. CONT]
MPVPVPNFSKPPAHAVIKQQRAQSGASSNSNTFSALTYSHSLPPQGPPAAFGSREEWISSLPDWRRNKPRRIWEEDEPSGFHSGLAPAFDAGAIKGQRAQACVPPPYDPVIDEDADEIDLEREYEYIRECDQLEYDVESQWSGHSSGTDDHIMDLDAAPADRFSGLSRDIDPAPYAAESQGFLPTTVPRERIRGTGFSPRRPVTPFGEYVDRATAAEQSYAQVAVPSANWSYAPQFEANYPQPAPAPFYEQQEPAQAPESAAPSATLTYKAVADPLADWMADYVWKACTVGISLAPHYSPHGQHELRYSAMPPSHLATSIRSLFMSTLLQPSAIVLAVWYIVRLPVSFGPVVDGGIRQQTEIDFRSALLGMNHRYGIVEREVFENNVAFRLVLLGCMLANKWLDDHTFSNKTWHSISGVPIQALNTLETAALKVFKHDLTVPKAAWSQWLDHVLSYQSTSSPIGPPQPISRPGNDPRAIIRRSVEQLIDVAVRSGQPHPCEDRSCSLQHPQPVFIETEERKHLMETPSLELDIDLDEDGPLREEYMPKRRVSRAGSDRDARFAAVTSASRPADDWNMDRALPPPARWSPGEDEPLSRGMKAEMNRHYAPQPAMAPPPPPMQPSFAPSYGSTASWAQNKIEPAVPKMQLPHIQTSSSYAGMHGRSMSMSTAGGPYEAPAGHGRSASQSFYGSSTGYAYSDMRMTAKPSYQPQQESYWSAAPAQRPAYEAAWSRLVQPASAIFHQQAPWIRVGV